MPIHLNSIKNGEYNDIFSAILSKDMDKADEVFVSQDKTNIHTTKYIIDSKTENKIGKIVFTMKVREENIEILDVDIVLLNNNPIKLKFLEKLEGSSEANEYYEVQIPETKQHFQIETVNRYIIENEIEGTEQEVYISAFPFELNVFENMETFNKFAGFENPKKVGQTDYKVKGYAEDMIACGGVLRGNYNESSSFIIGKVVQYDDVTAILGEIPVDFTLIQIYTAVGIIPIAVSREVFDLRDLSTGKIIAMFADVKADFGKNTLFEDKLKNAISRLNKEKIKGFFPNGEEQIENVGREILFYTNGKIKSEDMYGLYIRDYLFFSIDMDIYEFYNHMKFRYKDILIEDEQMKLMAIILINHSNPKYKFNQEDNLEATVDCIKYTIRLTEENTNEGVMKGAIGKFGLEATNPIPVCGHCGVREYFKNISLKDKREFVYERLYSCSVDNINGIVDIYILKDKESKKEICELYMCIYNKYTSKLIPEGFNINI